MAVFNRQLIQSRLRNDPYYRLQSAEEIAVAAELGIKIDVNQACVDDWLRLPGLSIHQARLLVELRSNGVPFYSLEDVAAALGVPVQRLQPLAPILQFCYYDETYTPQKINPNRASVGELTQIPAVSLELAQAIVQNRSVAGSYRNLVDFQQRLCLSGQVTAQLMHYLQFKL